MNWQNKIAEQVSSIPRSGIREFFDLVTGRTDIISLGVGEPDFVTPWNIREAAIYSLEKGHTSYTSNYGLESLRRSIVKYVDGFFHVNYDPLREVLVTVGVSEAIDLALRAILNPGDEVLYHEPCYVSYAPSVNMAYGVATAVPTSKRDLFALNPEELDAAITPRTTVLMLNFPGTPWSGLRLRPELSKVLKGDPRRLIYEGSYQEEIPDLASYDEASCGYMLIKYTNTDETDYYNEAGETNNGTQMSETDYPVFRLADAYLMLAECQLHGVNCNGYDYLNKVRARVDLAPLSNPAASEVLAERQRELYMEGHRRSDLIRFGLYTGSNYLWSWKGGVYTGASIPEYRALFPIPTQYVATVGQNPGY